MITYTATNTLNGKFYIGSTTNFEKRKKGHLQSKSNYPFQNALRKNPEAFEWEFVEDDCEEPVLEQALLDMWHGTEQCYNLTPYATRPTFRGKNHTEEHKQQMSDIRTGEGNPFFGQSHSEGFRQRQSDRMTGENNPMFGRERPEMVERMSGENNPMYGVKGENHPCFGKKRWVNAAGERKLQVESPGPEWQNGLKWRQGKTL